MKVNDLITSGGIIGKVKEINGTKVKFISAYGWVCNSEMEFCKLASEDEAKKYESNIKK
jgi:hypothetical protein